MTTHTNGTVRSRAPRALLLCLLAAFLLPSAPARARPGAEAETLPPPFRGLTILPENAEPRYPIRMGEAEWRARLPPDRCFILRDKGTEAPFTGLLNKLHEDGVYYSAATGQPLFRSEAKFDSGTGWPSFFQPVSQDAVVLKWDNSHGMRRVEVLDSSSGSHLGHLFEDGPAPTGLRYCINSGALIFVPKGAEPPQLVKDYLARFGEK